MGHLISEEAEKLLDQELKVLDKGFVRLVDYLGTDARIVQAARVSYGEGTKTVREDKGLINYLIKHKHTSPLEQVVLTFHCKMPIFVARQWIRHRTARLNEISGRYSVLKDEFYVPAGENIKPQSKTNKQGRDEESLDPEIQQKVIDLIIQDQALAYKHYEDLLGDNVARELARVNLPLSLYTEWYWQIDLHNLFHFLKLRLDSHAQFEIRMYGEALAICAKAVAPLAYESFEDNILYGANFSKTEIENIKALISGDKCNLSGRNRIEFYQKLGIEDVDSEIQSGS